MDPLFIALLLYLAALVLAGVDIFVPSGGMLLILAGLAAVAAILFGFRSSNGLGMGMIVLVLMTVPVFTYAAVSLWPRTPIGKRVILRPPTEAAPAPRSSDERLQQLVGQVYIAETALLPSGQIKVGHRRFNAVAETGIVEEGCRVKIIAVRERNLVVRLTDEALSPRAEPKGSGETPLDLPAPTSGSEESLLDVPAEELGLDSIEEPDEYRG